ncbi:MAG: dipeptide ABC transporter ATP-binding protein DppD [Rhodovulum sulfidophilum]|uniref:Dipeptide ABC transporter ATP-binding protein DppD n=1 Tax=Rhodovulum sulfidophilum TaxID=35806 RepID=A0A2W5N3G9_RHOSU|nr:MAG: dipeptide ABC transporter ATP-binding protein DppD [Rhodovulum sulfidophilum]
MVRVRDLRVTIQTRDGRIHAVGGVDFDLDRGRVLCLVGESGAGKSVTLRALNRLNPPRRTVTSGRIEIDGHDIRAASEREMADLRGKLVGMIFQEPMTAFDPVFTVGRQITETIRRHDHVSQAEAERRTLDLFDRAQIPSARARLRAYPHELSGGLRQRVMIAMALACRPKLLLADEPTTALDATVQIQILLLLRELQRELGMGILFVTHDFGVAAEIADEIAVMYAGLIVEQGPTAAMIDSPLHPYMRGLMDARVRPEMRGAPLRTIPGAPPGLETPPRGCAFAPRCALAAPPCLAATPPIEIPAPDHRVRCVRSGPAALFPAEAPRP